MREKRQHFRERLLKPIRVHLAPPEGGPEGGPAHEALVVDLSLSGALLYCPVDVPPKSSVKVDLPVEQGSTPVRVPAEVIRCVPRESERGFGYAVAVHFLEQVPETTMILARNILFTYSSVIHSHMN